MTLLLHVLGAGVLVWALLDGEKIDWRSIFPRDDWGGPPPGDEPQDPEPPAPTGGLGVPLPDASPSGVRLREPGRISEGHPAPARRPAHAPERRPRVPEPAE